MGTITNTRTLLTYSTLSAASAAIAANDTLEITGTWVSPDSGGDPFFGSAVTINVLGDSRHDGVVGSTHYRLNGGILYAASPINVDYLCQNLTTHTPDKNAVSLIKNLGSYTFTNCIIKGPGNDPAQASGGGIVSSTYTTVINLTNCQVSGFNKFGLGIRQVTDEGTTNINSCTFADIGSKDATLGGIGIERNGGGNFSLTTFNIFNTLVMLNNSPAVSSAFYDKSSTGSPTFNIRQCVADDASSGRDGSAEMIANDSVLADTDQGEGNFVIVSSLTAGSEDYRLQEVSLSNSVALEAHSVSSALGMTMPLVDVQGEDRFDPFTVGFDYQSGILPSNDSGLQATFSGAYTATFPATF